MSVHYCWLCQRRINDTDTAVETKGGIVHESCRREAVYYPALREQIELVDQ